MDGGRDNNGNREREGRERKGMKIGGMQQHHDDDESFLSKLQDDIGLWRYARATATSPRSSSRDRARTSSSLLPPFPD